MWLINTETLQLEFFMNPPKGSYAILSHTWGLEEVPFHRDLASARWMHGFAKIEKTCELAKEKNLQYAWVDTCCIDKSSSAELSEAINSMFRWYQEAAVCFAYLIDASLEPVNHEGSSDGGDEAAMVEQLRGCRYFTRGWTLQELLAPKNVELFDVNWKYMGTKDSQLLDTLSEVTGIEPMYLKDGDYIWSATVGTRMRWASKRETTRLEDTAYCLLGIFGINMPLIYGEGEKAFLRLQEEICKQSNDLYLFAWTEQPDNPLSYSSPRKYRGIFACHPCEFADFEGPDRRDIGCNFKGEFVVTSRGVRFDDVHMLLMNNKIVLSLDYNVFHRPNKGIFLQGTPDGYLRSNPDTLAEIPKVNFPLEKRQIYIQKQIPRRWENPTEFGDEYADAFLFQFRGDLQLVTTTPQESFDYREQAFLTRGECFLGVLHLNVDNNLVYVVCCLGKPLSPDAAPDQPLEARYKVISSNSNESREILKKALTSRHEDKEEVYKSLVSKNCSGSTGQEVFPSSYLWGNALIVESHRDMHHHVRITYRKSRLSPWLNKVRTKARL
ncbi:heterokaryon incompatibility protein-domain-containing protein [Hypoxylon cercidicola]|nr:heterokaryon incompatibility protein-domain-containing protein [Hypoxylon cercidicola]